MSRRARAWRFIRRWQGAVLVVAALVSTVWLALTGQLILYIHPRYIVFTVVMALIGIALVVSSAMSGHDHDHAEDEPHGVSAALSAGSTVLTLLLAVGLVIVPPATLTTATANQRVVNSAQTSTTGAASRTVSTAQNAATARFTVADWASLLRQTSDESFYRNKPADVVGTVNADKGAPDDVFFVTRFVITCCAVDAQPVGVPVYLPGWKNTFSAGEWVHVKGSFDTDPSSTSAEPIVLLPTTTVKTSQPSDPYLY